MIDLRTEQLRLCVSPCFTRDDPKAGRYLFEARAGQPSARATLRCLGDTVTIAIAVFAASWFGACLISAAGQL